MDEQDIFSLELDGLFPELDVAPRMSGTAGEILEHIADEWGLEDDKNLELDVQLDGVYPSTRAIKAHHILEEQMGKSGSFNSPDLLIIAMLEEGLAKHMTDEEFEDFLDDKEAVAYEEARSSLDEEWADGVWET
ncbi:hypothetical protein KAU08_06600 [bacterium]|nr:hypothetical protein [bacterium]